MQSCRWIHHRFSLFLLLLAMLCPVSAHAVLEREQVDSPIKTKSAEEGAKDLSGKNDRKPKRTEDELIVKFKSGTDDQARKKSHAKFGATKKKEFSRLRMHHVKLRKGITVEEAIQEYAQDPNVEYAEPNFIYTAEALPDESRFSELWGMYNTGQTGGTPGADIHAGAAWDITTGSRDVVVAVIDTGIDYNHPDLAPNIWKNPGETAGNLIDDDGNGYPDDIYGIDTFNHFSWPFDDNGHGTHVAGTIGAVGNNGIGVAGVNWNVQIVTCKFLNAGGSGDTSGAVECLEYIRGLKVKGVNIVATSNSWGGGDYSQALYDAINAQRDILFIAAAGNDGADLTTNGWNHYPSGYELPNIISVAATDHNDNKAVFSNYGRRSVDISAPGVKILSTLPAQNKWNITGGYGLLSGTSMATPHVTGVAAQLKAQDPGRDWITIKNLLLAGGDNVSSMYERTVTGKRLNANGSLSCNNRPVFSALSLPTTITAGTPVTVSALSINCDLPVGPVVMRTSTGEVITLADDGTGADLAAGDGIFTGTWTPKGAKAILLFSSSAGQDTVEYPAFAIAGYTANTALSTPYSDSVPVSGYPPYGWSILSGSLPPGITLDASTGQFSGSSAQPGIYPFTLQAADVYGAKALKDLSISVYPAGISKAWHNIAYPSINISSDSFRVGKKTDVAVDADGNSYVIRQGFEQDYDFFLVKYSPAGQELWSRKYSQGTYDQPAAVTVDRDGYVYVGGFTAPNCQSCILDTEYFLVKYDPDGVIVWTRKRPGNIVYDITSDANGNIYMVGSPDDGGYLTVKYDAAGNELWSTLLQPGTLPYLWNPYIAVDTTGNVYITGYRETLGYPVDTPLIKYDASGNFQWYKFFKGDQEEAGQDIAVDANGDVYVTGWLLGTPPTLFLRKFSANGDPTWTKTYPAGVGTKGYGIAVDKNNSIHVIGSIQSTPYAGYDYLILKYDPSGNRLWAITYDGGVTEAGERLALDALGNLMLTGSADIWRGAFTIKLNDANAFAITTASLPAGASGTAYNAALSVKGGTAPYTWSIASGNLPPGLTIDPASGAVSGTPAGRGDAVVEVRVIDGTGKITVRLLRMQVMGIDDTSLNPVIIGVAFNQLITGGGGIAPYSWGIASGSLPSGLSLESSADGSPRIKGTANGIGNYSFILSLQDSTGKTAFRPMTLSVVAPPCVASQVRIARTPLLYFDSIQAAADAAADSEVLQLQGVETFGDITINRGTPLALKGGYDCYFADNSGYTTVHGNLVVSNGTVEVNNIILAQ